MSSEKRKCGRPRKPEHEKVVPASISWPTDVIEGVREYSRQQGMSFSRGVMELALIALELHKKESGKC